MITLERAIALAAESHQGQTGKVGAVAALHPASVALDSFLEFCFSAPIGRIASCGRTGPSGT